MKNQDYRISKCSIMNEVVVEMRGVSRHFILGKRLMRSAAFICLFFCGLLVGVLFGLTSTANAVTLDNAGQVRDGVSVASLLGTSYDGPDFDAFKPFQGFSGSDILSLSSFTGQANGSQLSAILLSEAACFDGRNPNLANNFGVVDAAGNFMSILDTANVDPGGTGLIAQGADDEFTFALQSPEALFSADDKANADGRAHLIAMQVDKDTLLPKTIECYAISGMLIKTLHYSDIKDFGGGVSRPSVLKTDSPLNKGYTSVMIFAKVQKKELADEIFTLNYLSKVDELR